VVVSGLTPATGFNPFASFCKLDTFHKLLHGIILLGG
jgi:hypothetical protein